MFYPASVKNNQGRINSLSFQNHLNLKWFISVFFIFISSSFFAEDISVMSFNLWNYFVVEGKSSSVKSETSRDALIQVIKKADPDIIMVSEIGGQPALDDLIGRLKKAGLNYPSGTVMYGQDRTRYIGCIAKFAPLLVRKNYDLTYKIKPKDDSVKDFESVPVQRGFLHVVFDIDGYKLNIINAHLKSRLFHPRYNQTDMRRFEARLLKYYVNDIIEKYPEANILLTGDYNDLFNSNPLITLRGMDKKPETRLYDLRPVDNEGASWTHWWKDEDSYGRIDYLLASPTLLPEINFKKNIIFHQKEYWLLASDHRPVITYIHTKDNPLWKEDQINQNFTDGIYSGQN